MKRQKDLLLLRLARVLVRSLGAALAPAGIVAFLSLAGAIPAGGLKVDAVDQSPPLRAHGRGNPWISLTDGRELRGPSPRAAPAATRVPEALAPADLDADGTPDLVVGYSMPGGGIIAVYRGNADAVYPDTPEARQRRASGASADAPFLVPPVEFTVPVAADLLAAGDFDGDGQADVVAAAGGSEALYLLCGDGRGHLGEGQRIALPGRVTALASGEVNRADGLPDLVVGIHGASGPELLIFQAPNGALRAAPERLPLPADAASIAIGQLDDDFPRDIAVAAGDVVVIVHGRDRPDAGNDAANDHRVESYTARAFIESVAVGDFVGDGHQEVAALAVDGSVRLLYDPGRTADVRGRRAAHRFATDTASRAFSQALRARPAAQSRAGFPAFEWGAPIAVRAAAASIRRSDERAAGGGLVRARVSSLGKEDLLVLDAAARQVHVLHQLHLQATTEMGVSAAEPVTFDVDARPLAVLPMRLSPHAINGMVVLRDAADPVAVSIPVPLRTFRVDSAGDQRDKDLSDGECRAEGFLTDVCTLRAAIEQANASMGADAITFDPAIRSIRPLDELPFLTESVAIDGTAGANDSSGQPWVEIDGSGAVTGLSIDGGSSLVRGLIVNGALDPGGLSGNCGIDLDDLGGNIVEDNYLGTNNTGSSARPSFCGLAVHDSSDNYIGSATGAERNVISGNGIGGGLVISGLSMRNRVEGNYIGTDPTGFAPLANQAFGLGLASEVHDSEQAAELPSDNEVAHNIISATHPGVEGFSGFGVGVEGYGNLIHQNLIGLDASLTGLGNSSYGLAMAGYGNTVLGNSIAFNELDGVLVAGPDAVQNLISRNSIFRNSGLGINLTPAAAPSADAVTANDAGDRDRGGNELQNFPVLSVVEDGTRLLGALDSAPSSSFRIEFFANRDCDASGYGEGETYLDALTVTTDAQGHAEFEAPFEPPAQGAVTATATDPLNNTSEFSACARVSELQLSPMLIIGKGFCADQPRPIQVFDTGAKREVTLDSDVTYEWVRDPLEQTLVNAALKKAVAYLGDKANPKLSDIHVAKINVQQGVVTFEAGDEGIGVNVVRARRGGQHSNYAFVISGIRFVTASSLDVAPVSLGNTVVDALAAGFGKDMPDSLMILFTGGPYCNGTWGPVLTDFIGTTGYATLTSLKFDLFGGLISDVDFIDGVQKAIGLVAVKVGGMWGALAAMLGRPAVPVVASQFLDFEVSSFAAQSSEKQGTRVTEDGVISVTDEFSTDAPFFKGFVQAKKPGLSAVQATFDMTDYCLGKASDGFLVWVAPQLNRVQIRNEMGKRENPADLYVNISRQLHAVAMIDIFRGSGQPLTFSFEQPDDPSDFDKLVAKFLPTLTGTYPEGAKLTDGFYVEGDVYAHVGYTVDPFAQTFTIVDLQMQVPIPNLQYVTTWQATQPLPPAQPVVTVGESTGTVTGVREGNGQVRVDVCIPFATGAGSDPAAFNLVRVLGGTPPLPTPTPTATSGGAATPTPTLTPTRTPTTPGAPSFTPTRAGTPTPTATRTLTRTPTLTVTRTRAPTLTPTPTPTVLHPIIERIEPAYGRQGTTDLELKITGANFKPGAAVSFQSPAGIRVIPPSPPNFGYVGPTELRQSIDVAGDAVVGVRQVFVTNLDGLSGGIRPFNEFAVTIADPGPCPGDCDGNSRVTESEFAVGIVLAFDRDAMARCPQHDRDSNGRITAAELVAAVQAIGQGCAEQTPTVTPTPSVASDCCQARAAVGCEAADCTACVCLFDDYCCQIEWDDGCVELAQWGCPAVCPCEPAGPTPTPTPTPISASNCCKARSDVGCDTPVCSACVCGFDELCCQFGWDELCVEEAGVACVASCPCRPG